MASNLTRQLTAALNKSGLPYTFKRPVLNTYEEPTGVNTDVVTLQGIFYTNTSYVTLSLTDGARVPNKGSAQILAIWDDAKLLHVDDLVETGGHTYKVNWIDNIQNKDFGGDISLEVVL